MAFGASVEALFDEDRCSRVKVSFTCEREPVADTSMLSDTTASDRDSGQSRRGPAAGPSLLWLLGMGATKEELEREQFMGGGKSRIVEASCAVISLPLGKGYQHALILP